MKQIQPFQKHWLQLTSIVICRLNIAFFTIFLPVIMAAIIWYAPNMIVPHKWTQVCAQYSLQWHHNECDGVSNHQPHDCLLNRLFKAQIKENIKARRHWPVNSPHKGPVTRPVTRKMFPFDDAIMVDRVLLSILWRYAWVSLVLLWPACVPTFKIRLYLAPTKIHFVTMIEDNDITDHDKKNNIYIMVWALLYHKCLKWDFCVTWWCRQMETFSALLAICVGNSPVTGEFPSQRPVTRSFDVFFDLHLNKKE